MADREAHDAVRRDIEWLADVARSTLNSMLNNIGSQPSRVADADDHALRAALGIVRAVSSVEANARNAAGNLRKWSDSFETQLAIRHLKWARKSAEEASLEMAGSFAGSELLGLAMRDEDDDEITWSAAVARLADTLIALSERTVALLPAGLRPDLPEFEDDAFFGATEEYASFIA